MWRLVYHHDLGHSYYNRESVNHIIADAAPVTASLVFGGALFWLLIAIPIGVLSALRPRSLLDRGAMTFVLIGISAHPIWIGLIFAYFFGYTRTSTTPIYSRYRTTPTSSTHHRGSREARCSGPIT